MSPAEYLKLPYARRLTPDEAGGFVATIQEFPGCVAEGESPAEAYANLESAAETWIDAALAQGQSVPQPLDLTGYSGKFALRMPRGLHRQAAEIASAQGTSLNQLFVTAIAQYLGAVQIARQPIGDPAILFHAQDSLRIAEQLARRLAENQEGLVSGFEPVTQGVTDVFMFG